MDSAPTILPLPADAVAQIKSSIAITSLNAVAIELLKNSLDAHSVKIEVTVDYCRGNCVVEDDGLGIPPLEFKENGGLGKLHHTSKLNDHSDTYGNRGAFIASVAALALVSITSHHHLHQSHNTLMINRSQVIARHTPAPAHQHIHTYKHGTRVVVRDLFGNMPVRVKQRIGASSRLSGCGREWDELRKLVAGLILAWPSAVLLIVRDAVSGQKLHLRGTKPSSPRNIRSEAQLIAHVCSTLSQTMFISSPCQSKWVLTRASTPRIRMRGAISQEPAPTKAAQFLSLGIEPLNIQHGHGALFDEINKLFENSSFGNEDELSDLDSVETKRKYDNRLLKTDSFTNKELRVSRKGVNRWPMFYIQIEFLDLVSQEVELGATYDLVEDCKGSLSSVLELLRAMVLEFLKKYNFRPRIAQTGYLSSRGKSESSRNVSEGGCRTEQVDQSRPQYLKHFQPGRIGSPFDMWSRVKSGRPKPPISIPEHFCQSEHRASIGENESLGSSAHIPTINATSTLASDLNSLASKNDNSIISRSGKVTRLPFDSLTPVAPRTEFAIPMSKNDLSVLESNRKIGKESLNRTDSVHGSVSLVNSGTVLGNQSLQIDSLKSRVSLSFTPDSRVNFPIEDGVALNEDTELGAGSTKWLDGILRNWNNPVYRPTETPIYQVTNNNLRSESQLLLHGCQNNYSPLGITRAFQETSPGLDGRISREALRQADVISQVDNKFILIKIPAHTVYTEDENKSAAQETLVVVDQHAADERCRVEELLEELCNRPNREEGTITDASPQPGVLTTLLAKPISFIMPEREVQLLQTHAQHFANWGILYDVRHTKLKTDQQQEHKVIVRSLPPSIIERCTTVPKLLVELLRSEVWKHSEGQALDTVEIETDSTNNGSKHPWLRKVHRCPRALLELLNSRACRSAIMFNDVLSNAQCKALISRLAECAFPFQCAHGRPSMVPLLSLDSFTQEVTSNERVDLESEAHFSAALKRWKYGVAGITDGTYNYGQ